MNMKSIIQTEKECFYTHSKINLHKHHIFPSGLRNASEKWGCWVYLRGDIHMYIHSHEDELIRLKRIAQTEFEKLYGHEEYMKIFKRNYL